MNRDDTDHKGLIREAFRIEGISEEECRSIFVDWALSLPESLDMQAAIAAVSDRHAAEPDDHPMRRILNEACAGGSIPARRRGGWRSRRRLN